MVRLPLPLAASLRVALITGLAVQAICPAKADGDTVAPKPLPADVQNVLSHVADLDLLVALTPLKLTPEQIDKLLGAIEPIAKSDDEITKQECETVRTIAADVEKARSDSLKGATPDSEATGRITKALTEFNAKNAAAHKEAIEKVVEAGKSALTPEQIKAIEMKFAEWSGGKIKLPSQLRENSTKQKEYIQTAALSAFADRILLVQRTIPLLKAMKTSGAGSSAAADPGKTTPTAGAAAPPAP